MASRMFALGKLARKGGGSNNQDGDDFITSFYKKILAFINLVIKTMVISMSIPVFIIFVIIVIIVIRAIIACTF
jgi:hypothetical protein